LTIIEVKSVRVPKKERKISERLILVVGHFEIIKSIQRILENHPSFTSLKKGGDEGEVNSFWFLRKNEENAKRELEY